MEQIDLYKKIQSSFEKQNFLSLLGASLERAEPGTVTIACENRTELRQQQGFLHGGVVTTLADVACGYAALTCMPDGAEVLSVEFKINFMRPATTTKITACGQVLKAGKTLITAEAVVTGEDGTIIAKMLSTMIRTQTF